MREVTACRVLRPRPALRSHTETAFVVGVEQVTPVELASANASKAAASNSFDQSLRNKSGEA